VRLTCGDKAHTLKPSQQECWSLTVAIPGELPAGEYRASVFNGYPGQAEGRDAGLIRIAPHAPVWKDTPFDVTAYGAIANDGLDDTDAIQAALDAAGANGGGTVRIPRGRFEMNDPIRIPRCVLLQGAGMKLSQLYWRDTPEPVEALIYGSHSFGIEDLTIMAANHRYGILAERDTPDAGQVTLRRLYLYLNRFTQVSAEQAAKRFLPMPWEHAICVGGENVQVTDCEVFSSRSPFGLGFGGGLRNSVIRNNRFFEGDTAHVLAGEGIIFEDNVVEGGPTGRGGGDYANRLYYARNTVGMMSLHDGECFTTDGGGNAPVKLVSCEGTRLTIGDDIDWNRWTDKGKRPARVCIMNGTGAGQTRLIVSHNGREAQLDRSWTVSPNSNSVLHVIPNSFCQNLLIGNRFHDTTVVQSYSWAIDWILAGNHFSRAGGPRITTHGGDPAWYMQYVENEIDVGSGYRSSNNQQPPQDSQLAVVSGQARCQILRRNVLHNNARIVVTAAAKGALIEHNRICDADRGIEAGGAQTMLWGNRFERVKEPLAGVADSVFMQPADRLLGELSAIRDALPAGCGETLARLEELADKDPLSPGLLDEVRGCVLQLVRLAAASQQDYPQDLLAVLWGVRLAPSASDKFRPLLDGSGGQGKLWLVLPPAAGTIPARLSLEFPPQPGCRVENLKDLVLTPGTSKGLNVDVTLQPGVVGACGVPVRWTVEGEGWKLNGHGRLKVGDEWCGRITQWAICGPFPNSALNALDEGTVYGPERRLDLAARYDTLSGKRGWETVVAQKLDFVERFGPQRSAAAYAVAVLRAKKPTAVAIRFEVPGHGILEPSLNGRIWRVPNHYGRTFSRTLKPGDNMLLVKLANIDKRWTLEAWLRLADSAEPGDVEVVPVANFPSVTALNPPPRPPIPEGKELPCSGGVDWRLVYEDDFDRTRLGTDWGYGPGSWAEHPFEFGNGVIQPGTQMYSFLTYAQKLTSPFRIEYDVNAKGGSISSVMFTRANEVGIFSGINNKPVGYVVTSGRGGCAVSREAVTVAESKGPPAVEPDKWCHVTVQFLPPKITVLVNNKAAVEYEDRQWLTAPDTFSFMGDAWSLPQIDNVRIYRPAASTGP
jgi:hypothetical protein